MSSLKLVKYATIKANLVAKSGLRVGGTEAAMSIGGAENPIIRDFWGNPYIPGSSLKGKLRSLLEYKLGKTPEGKPCGCGQEDCLVCRIFGPHWNQRHSLGPSRLIVRDAPLSADTVASVNDIAAEGRLYSETKTETMIDRRTGVAATGSLRTQERLPAGARFDMEMSLRIFEGDDEKAMVECIRDGLAMLEKDYLGSSGTRGYGWVGVENLTVTEA